MNKHTSSVSLIDGHIEDKTDAEIRKALKICGNIMNADCKECSYEGKNCVVRLIQSTNDLIKRQQAENERLTTLCTEQNEELCRLQKVRANILKVMKENISQTKSEAIKEFAERLKAIFNFGVRVYEGKCTVDGVVHNIDNLVKEMTE